MGLLGGMFGTTFEMLKAPVGINRTGDKIQAGCTKLWRGLGTFTDI